MTDPALVLLLGPGAVAAAAAVLGVWLRRRNRDRREAAGAVQARDQAAAAQGRDGGPETP
jgi:hypothetical protein